MQKHEPIPEFAEITASAQIATANHGWRAKCLQRLVRLDLPVLLVVGLRLGCLNHALLTLEAVQTRGLRLAGWIANAIDPAMAALRGPIDAFFTAVQVNSDNGVVRRNRLNLLHRIRAICSGVADLTRIEG